MQPRYLRIEDLLSWIDAPNGQACRALLERNLPLFRATQGSTQNHQAWRGGYYDHVQEVMNIVVVLYQTLDALRPLPFTLSDALLVSFLHDLEKPWGYTLREDGTLERSCELVANSDQHAFRMRMISECGITLQEHQEDALKYVEGEKGDYSNTRRTMSPLATLCHMADSASARLWFDHPLEEQDPWGGANRFRN